MVRIKVIRKSQLIGSALIAALALALLLCAVYMWHSGMFSGGTSARSELSARIETEMQPESRTGGNPSGGTDDGIMALSMAAAEPEAAAVYVVDVNFMATPAPTQEPRAVQTLTEILGAGLSADSADDFVEVNALGGALSGRNILIYHTHTHEAYEKQPADEYAEISAYRTADSGHSVVRVGDELTALLEAMGAQVYHDTGDYEQDSLSTAYNRSLATLKKLTQGGITYDMIIDLHRDAYSAEGSGNPFAATVNGKSVARLMVLLGTGEGKSGGAAFSEKPDFERNMVWGQRITDTLNEIAPGICRPVMVKSGRYNQHISERCLLIEVGHNRNTLEQALGSMPYLAQAIANVLGQTAG